MFLSKFLIKLSISFLLTVSSYYRICIQPFQHTVPLYLTPLNLKLNKSEDLNPVHRNRHKKRNGFC